jgi:hypothetical protein
MLGRISRALALVVVLGASCGAGAAHAVPAPNVFFGLDYRPAQPAPQPEVAALGIGVTRQVFDWGGIEAAPGRYRFSYYDDYVLTMARQGITVLPVLLGTPRYRSSAPRRHARRGFWPPRHPRDLGAFAALLVRRYGPDGVLWREHPEVAPVPVRAWQVWNEPNLPVYWPSGPSPRGYTRLLEAVGRAIHRADPGATVVSAGIPQSRLGMPLLAFVRGMYRAGARGSFDQLGVSAYGRSAGSILWRLGTVRAVMNARHDRRTGIWVTEFGWATDGPRTPFTSTAGGQAKLIGSLLRGAARRRAALGLHGLIYYTWADQRPSSPGADFWGLHTGLVDADGVPKPGYFAFRDSAHGLEAPG